MTIKEKLEKLPELPGVYLMKNSDGKIIYVGKAKILKNRVRQYFHSSSGHTPKVKAMVENIADFEYIITGSEREAFVLECNLIKEYRPHYNILLKDDKTYPLIKVTKEAYPRIVLTRRAENDGSTYFGPYTSAYFCREMIELTNKIFRLPTCSKRFPRDFGKRRPCLYHSMGRCMGVCTGGVSEEEYQGVIADACEFIKGKHKSLLEKLTEQMEQAASELQFERAADLRDKINSIKYVAEKQNVSIFKDAEADIFALRAEDNDIAFEVIFIREGKMTGHDSYSFDGASGIDDSMLMSDFLSQYYEKSNIYIPKLVVLSCEAENSEMLAEHFSELKGVKVELRRAVRGQYKELSDMAVRNAEKTLKDSREQKMKYQLKKSAAAELGKVVGAENIPLRIEAYDISHISGDSMVGAMVVFCAGKYSKKDNRYFKIKTVEGNNDYACLKEVMTRRFEHCLKEYKAISEGTLEPDDAKFALLPDMILMDGGKGQMTVAAEVLSELGLDIPVYGMVKNDKHRTRGLISEQGEIDINPSSAAFRLITCIQDEVHRLAIGYHHKTMEHKMIKSPLLSLDGVGEKTYAKLIKRYKTVTKIKEADEEQLSQVIGRRAARSVYEYYHNAPSER